MRQTSKIFPSCPAVDAKILHYIFIHFTHYYYTPTSIIIYYTVVIYHSNNVIICIKTDATSEYRKRISSQHDIFYTLSALSARLNRYVCCIILYRIIDTIIIIKGFYYFYLCGPHRQDDSSQRRPRNGNSRQC